MRCKTCGDSGVVNGAGPCADCWRGDVAWSAAIDSKDRLYEHILDGLRRAGWDRIEAENEAYSRVYK